MLRTSFDRLPTAPLASIPLQGCHPQLFGKGDNTAPFDGLQPDVDQRWERLQKLEPL
jgi:hypothetical protein